MAWEKAFRTLLHDSILKVKHSQAFLLATLLTFPWESSALSLLNAAMLSTAQQSNSGGSQARKCLCTSLSQEGGGLAEKAGSQGGELGRWREWAIELEGWEKNKYPRFHVQTVLGGLIHQCKSADRCMSQRDWALRGQFPELLTNNTAVWRRFGQLTSFSISLVCSFCGE